MRINGEPTPLNPTPEHPFFIKRAHETIANWYQRLKFELVMQFLLAKVLGMRLRRFLLSKRSSVVYNIEVEYNHDFSSGLPAFWFTTAVGPALRSWGKISKMLVLTILQTVLLTIFAGTDERAAEARQILEDEGIGINDADNGVFLPKNTQVPNPTGAQVHFDGSYRRIL